jgi:hypothetical protein
MNPFQHADLKSTAAMKYIYPHSLTNSIIESLYFSSINMTISALGMNFVLIDQTFSQIFFFTFANFLGHLFVDLQEINDPADIQG